MYSHHTYVDRGQSWSRWNRLKKFDFMVFDFRRFPTDFWIFFQIKIFRCARVFPNINFRSADCNDRRGNGVDPRVPDFAQPAVCQRGKEIVRRFCSLLNPMSLPRS